MHPKYPFDRSQLISPFQQTTNADASNSGEPPKVSSGSAGSGLVWRDMRQFQPAEVSSVLQKPLETHYYTSSEKDTHSTSGEPVSTLPTPPRERPEKRKREDDPWHLGAQQLQTELAATRPPPKQYAFGDSLMGNDLPSRGHPSAMQMESGEPLPAWRPDSLPDNLPPKYSFGDSLSPVVEQRFVQPRKEKPVPDERPPVTEARPAPPQKQKRAEKVVAAPSKAATQSKTKFQLTVVEPNEILNSHQRGSNAWTNHDGWKNSEQGHYHGNPKRAPSHSQPGTQTSTPAAKFAAVRPNDTSTEPSRTFVNLSTQDFSGPVSEKSDFVWTNYSQPNQVVITKGARDSGQPRDANSNSRRRPEKK